MLVGGLHLLGGSDQAAIAASACAVVLAVAEMSVHKADGALPNGCHVARCLHQTTGPHRQERDHPRAQLRGKGAVALLDKKIPPDLHARAAVSGPGLGLQLRCRDCRRLTLLSATFSFMVCIHVILPCFYSIQRRAGEGRPGFAGLGL
jgi:hypothetical protein